MSVGAQGECQWTLLTQLTAQWGNRLDPLGLGGLVPGGHAAGLEHLEQGT